MTITDIYSRAALVRFTQRIRRRSKSSKNKLRNKDVAVKKIIYSVVASPWRLIFLLLSLIYFKTRPSKQNLVVFFFIQAGFMSCYLLFSPFFLYLAEYLKHQFRLITMNKTVHRCGKNGKTAKKSSILSLLKTHLEDKAGTSMPLT